MPGPDWGHLSKYPIRRGECALFDYRSQIALAAAVALLAICAFTQMVFFPVPLEAKITILQSAKRVLVAEAAKKINIERAVFNSGDFLIGKGRFSCLSGGNCFSKKTAKAWRFAGHAHNIIARPPLQFPHCGESIYSGDPSCIVNRSLYSILDISADANRAAIDNSFKPRLWYIGFYEGIRSQAAGFIIAGDVSLAYGADGGDECYRKGGLFKSCVFSIFGALLGIFGLWIIYFGIDGPWGSTRRLPAALGSASALVIVGWLIQVMYPLPVVLSEYASASFGSVCVSATTYRRAEDIWIAPIVVPKFELRNIQGQIFAADLVVSSDDAAFDERPEAFDRIRMDCADHVLADAVVNNAMPEAIVHTVVPRPSIGAEQANAIGHRLFDKPIKDGAAGVLNDACDDIALTANRAHNGSFAGVAPSAYSGFLIPMPVLIASADVGFINLDNPDQLAEVRVLEARADAMRHVEGCPVRADPHDPLNLEGTDAFLGGQHHMDHSEPSLKTDIRVFEDRSDQNRKPITASLGAARALPMEGAIGEGVNLVIAAARANDALGPPPRGQIRFAGIVGREQGLELRDGHLFGKLGHLERSLA